ncbi:apolipoprotein A-I [Pipistrellus kuhlii]|uniref:Apolipoprotein A1 n=1 Tax=Pipistrellus kuhlii TaxID=59472 RepID=A0A7J7WYJ7_PIPKU|nr:apolipoprotein A-I [Pipistrellus kuhlii]KAF6342479.1 apolipoprotein A1 [Pipistrellus kuhlii]
MKAVVLTLAVLFLTGGQARHTLQQDDPQTQWDRVREAASVYTDMLKEGGKELVSRIEACELAKKMNLKIMDNLDTLGDNITKLRDQLSQMMTQEYWNSLLTQDMNKDLEQAKERVTFYLQQLREKLGSKLREGASMSVEKLLERYGDQMPKDLATQLQALQEGRVNLSDLRVQAGKKLSEMHKKAGEKLRELQVKLWEKLSKLSENQEPLGGLLEDLRSGMLPVLGSLLLPEEGAGQ